MSEAKGVLRIPESVKSDAKKYRQKVGDLLSGQTSADAFRGYRVPWGIYEQRQSGKFMVRVRIAAGMVSPEQLDRLALLSRTYGDGVLHVTTRQDIQIHRVNIEHTADVVEGLGEVGLSPRGGGGNTVRNITACPRAGVCASEIFDVRPYAIGLTEYLLDFQSSFNLPRKFKVVFSGCSEDCALVSVADLGFFAKRRNDTEGFSVYAGGGLGGSSRVGIRIEEFVEAGGIFAVAEAMKRLFDEHGDRGNKHKARLRFVLSRVGEDEFIRLYKEQLGKVREEELKRPGIREIGSKSNGGTESGAIEPVDDGYVKWKETQVLAENKEGEFTVRVRLPLGDMEASDLEAVAAVSRRAGEGLVRTTQSQDLLVCRVREEDLPGVYAELRGLKTDVAGGTGPKLVACAGASTCRLGLCQSRGLAEAISAELETKDWPAEMSGEQIKISGCPNSCGQHIISGIGLQGRAKRAGGKLLPCYVVVAGGVAKEGEAKLAEPVGVVPAKSVPELVTEVWELLKISCDGGKNVDAAIEANKEQIGKLVKNHSDIPSAQKKPEYYRDFGSDEEFSLAGRGPAECGVGVMDVIQLDIGQGREELSAAAKSGDAKSKSEHLYKAVVAGARSLLITRGLEPRKDREIFAAFEEQLISPGWVGAEAKALLGRALDYRLGDVEDLTELEGGVSKLLTRIEELFGSLDASLNFRAEKVEGEAAQGEQARGGGQEIDLRGVGCPLNFVKAKLAMEKVGVGDILEVLLDEGEPVQNVPGSFKEQGQEVLEVSKCDGHYQLRVRRAR